MYPDNAFCDALTRRIIADYAFENTDILLEERQAVAQWVLEYPGEICTAQRDLAEELDNLLALHNLDTDNIAAGLIDAAHDAAQILERRDRRQREAKDTGPCPDPGVMSWLRQELAKGSPPEEQPVAGKHALPSSLYFRLKQEAVADGLPPPRLYASEQEEGQILHRLIVEVKNAEPFWRARYR